ncbi:dephospho-CoA kinase [Marixanthomonas spongiae]|uniref:Dephospho-CoA kinase n=1 Tax=Marixanthomonas spongiae TaxID=2174845 RepID=A0A2U0I601_9FLAO|nr:dephospho-CoA kinase [Marixanthomonas spongiae]PVW16538.1 dephospho-CoA kinase [Marixanthomonas spongiae]
MKTIGLTGGIGSGKTTVATMFSELGVPIYIADIEAKKLTNTSEAIKSELTEILGEKAYNKNGLNRKYVADQIFNNEQLLKKVNQIIHPRVAEHFKEWAQQQTGIYCIEEAAILFENGGYKNCDYTILVTAPKQLRIDRILKRDDTTETEIQSRMDNQWPDEKKKALADFTIENIDMEMTRAQVKEIHEYLLKTAQ